MYGNVAIASQFTDKLFLFKVVMLNGAPKESTTAEASMNAIVSQMTFVIEVLADGTVADVLVLKEIKKGDPINVLGMKK